MSKKRFLIVAVIALFAIFLAACGGQTAAPEAVDCPEAEPCPDCPACPEPDAPEAPADASVAVPFLADWEGSGHAASDTEAFRHWDEDDPAEVPTSCAKCHTSAGYRDFLGADDSEAGVVDAAQAPEMAGVTCEACHNEATLAKTSVVFPSGVEITDIGDSARCMECHQGRSSAASVNEAVGDGDADTVNEELGFINIHYYAAAATLYGSEVGAGYEYEGKAYQIRFSHAGGLNECIDCHNPHTLELKLEVCAECHGEGEPMDYRFEGSLADYDGDGDIEEGVYYEIETLRETLLAAIYAYAADTVGTAIVYDSHAYPYFFTDLNGDGESTPDEANYGNKYATWTPRLLKAAYNYQVASKDPGGFAHNAKYMISLLYDSIEDLGGDVSALHRNDPGHFDGTAEAFRHWDGEEDNWTVSSSCAKCHSEGGLPQFLAEGVVTSQPAANAFACTTCHDVAAGFPARYVVNEVDFPSGATLTFGEGAEANLCIQCHQGRSSGATVDGRIGDTPADEVSDSLGFVNIHYFPAGATIFGGEAGGGYQYAGKDYVGRFEHVSGFQTCADCHDVHALEVNVEACEGCHGSTDVDAYRIESPDYDGDEAEEGVVGEIETMSEALYDAIKVYAEGKGNPIVYESHSYPYFFTDTNGDGEATPDEANYGNRYQTWTPKLLRAAYNFQYAQKDPGAYAHNLPYMIQLLYDSIQDLGGDVSGFTRP